MTTETEPAAQPAHGARAALLALAAEHGFPALATRRGGVPAGESAWRSWLAQANYFGMGAAEAALRDSAGGARQTEVPMEWQR